MKTTILSALSMLLLASCVNFPTRGFERPEELAVIPDNYLYSGSETFDLWLDRPFTMRFQEVPMVDVFHTFPLHGFVPYRFDKLPPNPEPFSLVSPGMTRRQLLWTLARQYNLDYHYEYQDGVPVVMVVVAHIRPPTESFTVN